MAEDHGLAGGADDRRPQDLELYAATLTFTMQRIRAADRLLGRPDPTKVSTESAALQIRMSLENIVLSTLIANRPKAAMIAQAFEKKEASEVRRLLQRINPRYWPTAFKYERVDGGEDGEERWFLVEPDEPYLREDEWGPAYGYCSSLLHADNPSMLLSNEPGGLRAGDELAARVAKLQSISTKIWRLVARHMVHLSEVDHALICNVSDDLTVRPKVEVWTRSPTGRADIQPPT